MLNAAGEIGNGHDGTELPTANKGKQRAGSNSAIQNNKFDARTIVKDSSKVNKAAWI